MTLTGLSSNRYFCHNPIYITLSGINPNTKYVEYFPSVGGKGQISPLRFYTNGRTEVSFDISQVIKSLIPSVEHNKDYTSIAPLVVSNNWVSVTFFIKEVLNNGTVGTLPQFTKQFISGGIRTYNANQNISINTPLIPSEQIPQWGGYPIDYYYINPSNQMEKSNIIPSELKETRKIKGCNNLYFKFKNSLGGYSYWLFENSESEEKTKNLGVIERMNDLKDLGNTMESTITVISKVPKRFLPLIFDLGVSQEIFIYDGTLRPANQWEAVTSENNKVSQNLYNTNEKIKMVFKKQYRYNPSLLWSN